MGEKDCAVVMASKDNKHIALVLAADTKERCEAFRRRLDEEARRMHSRFRAKVIPRLTTI